MRTTADLQAEAAILNNIERMREAFALTGFPCALRVVRELEAELAQKQERAA